MINSILKLQAQQVTIESKQQQDTLKGLIGLISRSIQKMGKRHIQLTQISNEHFDVYIRKQAEEYLAKQTKMLTIAYDLIMRIIRTYEQSKIQQVPSNELIQQYLDEHDILNFMDFEVTKKYFTFIHCHYQPKVIQLHPMAA